MVYLQYQLNPCPFCAARVKESNHNWLSYDKNKNFSISCLCGACGPKRETKEKAIMAWNKREGMSLNAVWRPFNLQEEPVGFQGNLAVIDFASLLQFLGSVNKTGVLQVHHGHKKSALCLKNGQVIASSRNYGLQLGEMLFDHNLISLEKLQKALEKSKASGKHLGEALLDLKYIDQKTLRGLIRRQISENIQDLMQWTEGGFVYQDYTVEFDVRGVEDMSIVGLLLDASRISDELAGTQQVQAGNG